MREELQPIKNPDLEFKNLVMDLKSDDWSNKFEAISQLRRIVQYHNEVI